MGRDRRGGCAIVISTVIGVVVAFGSAVTAGGGSFVSVMGGLASAAIVIAIGVALWRH